MATLQEIPINYNALTSPGNINTSLVDNITLQNIMTDIPDNANKVTNGMYGITILLIMLVWLFWLLTDKSQYSEFRYTYLKGLGISLGIVSIIGINMLMIGFMTSYIHLAMLVTGFIVTLVWHIINNS